MPKYVCIRCGKKFPQKSNLDYHLNRKIRCIEIPQNPSILPHKSSLSIKSKEGNQNKCNYCGKEFTRKDNLMRHIDGYCKIKRENDRKMEDLMDKLIKLEENFRKIEGEMVDLKKENSEYKRQLQIGNINNGTQNINNGNQINNYITILPFGKENTTTITDKEYQRIMIRGFNSVPELVKKIHFDKNHPENHNVYISNMRDKYVLVYDGKNWELNDRDDALQQLYEDKTDILETKFEELLEKLDDNTIRMFKRFLKKKDDDCEEIQLIKKELKKILYNNRKIIEETKKTQTDRLLKSL